VRWEGSRGADSCEAEAAGNAEESAWIHASMQEAADATTVFTKGRLPSKTRRANDGIDRDMCQKVSVLSRCPSCRQLRLIDRYSRSDLEWMLASGNPIEGWCSLCDETWIFSEQDRAAAKLTLQLPRSSS